MERNKIYLGDAYELIKDVPDRSVDAIYTDIPYLIESGGGGSSPLAQRIVNIQHRDIVEIKDGIDYSIFNEFKRIMKKVNIFIWCSKLQIIDILNWWGG